MMTASRTFQGKWITTDEFRHLPVNRMFHRQLEEFPHRNLVLTAQNRHILFRRKFNLPETAGQPVLLHITADDYYKVTINGKAAGQGPTPGFHFHYFYNTIDVTEFLTPGENCIAVHTYYQGLINRVWVSGDNRHGLICDLVCGEKTLLCSDETFRMQEHSGFSIAGKVGYETQYLERYDAASPEDGFEHPEFDDSLWVPAKADPNADYTLYPQPSRMLELENIPPAGITKENNIVRIDFGGIFVGRLRLSADGPKGAEIVMRFGQELNADGSVRHAMRCNCNYIEYFRLSGRGMDQLNQFDYKSFRYAELELPDGVRVENIALEARHYPFELRVKPNRTDETSLRIWQLCVDTLHYGVQEVIQDCMDREKGYYLGDGCYSLLTFCLLTQDYTLMEKFFDDFFRTSFINRGLMTCGNCSFMQEIAEYPFIMINLAMMYCELTGNRQFILDRFDALADILDFYREEYAAPNGLLVNLDKWCVVEWPMNFRDGYDVDITEGQVCKTMHNVINAYYIGAVKSLNKIARLGGRAPYADAEQLQKAFIDAFWDPQKKLFRDSTESTHISLPANLFAWYYELAPAGAEFKENVCAMIRGKRLTRSVLFETFPMFCSLIRDGEEELFYDLLTDKDAWLNMLDEGATRTFESWGADLKWNTSFFHLTLSLGAAFLTDWDIKNIFRWG